MPNADKVRRNKRVAHADKEIIPDFPPSSCSQLLPPSQDEVADHERLPSSTSGSTETEHCGSNWRDGDFNGGQALRGLSEAGETVVCRWLRNLASGKCADMSR